MPKFVDVSTDAGVQEFRQDANHAGCKAFAVLYNPTAKRSISQNNLYWMWLDEIAEHCSIQPSKHYPKAKDAVHDAMRHKFLGTADKQPTASTTIPGQLISTTSLEPSEMSEYMTKIEAMSAGMSPPLYLTIPAENEYAKYREASQ